ncbi:MAG: hypothetical protein WC382_08205 [Methanoregulaceae archaeon]|jgi:hypothetical protein
MSTKQVLLVITALILLLVQGASAATFVLYDGDAAIAIAASPDGSAAVSFVGAVEPDSFSATVSASDSGGMTTTQESSADGARNAVSVGAAWGSDGDSTVTSASVSSGDLDTTQTVESSTGGSVSAEQENRVAGISGNAGSVATDASGSTAQECFVFLLGVSNVQVAGETGNSATASLGGKFAGFTAITWGIAESQDGDVSTTNANLLLGGMTFYNAATATRRATIASQDVSMIGALGSTQATAIDNRGNFASQSASFIAGALSTDQSADTFNSATATQEGSFAGLYADTAGIAQARDGDFAFTRSEVTLGAMTFDDTASASRWGAEATQDVSMIAALGSARAGAFDNQGNFAMQSASFVAGALNAEQTADTFNSASATQTGDFTGLGATINGFTRAADGDIALTHAGVLVGEMTFDNEAVAQDTTTVASQTVDITGLFGQAGADSFEHGNIATQDFVFTTGRLNVTQTADTFHSARATQTGDFAGLGGIAAGFAISPDGDVSMTDAEILLGEMTFDNEAVAQDTTTAVYQNFTMDGVLGHAGARSFDQDGNYASEYAFMAAGSIADNLSADTFTSANAYQQGTMSAALGFTGGEARSGDEHSWTNAGVVLGTMDFVNFATANGDTYAGQGVLFSGIDGIPVAGAGSTSAGSDDGTGNITEVGACFVLGTMDLSMQYADTEESAFASQFGTMGAGYGFTSADAEFENERSWSDAEVLVGTMAFDNIAFANGSTYADNWMMQFSGIDGIPVAGAGRARAGSDDGTNTTMIGTEFLLGTLDITQVSQTDGPVAPLYSNQTGEIPFAAYGHAWGEAFDTGSGATSWTDGSFLVGAMDITGDAGAGLSTSSSQALSMTALAGSTGAGSDDNAGNATEVYTEFIVGMLDVEQGAMTGNIIKVAASQQGTLIAGFGNTGGEATSGFERSWTESNITVGMNTYENVAEAGASTFAGQNVNMIGLSGRAVSGSDDGAGNTTEVGAEVTGGDLAGLLDVDWANANFENIPGLVTQIVGSVGGGYITMDQQADTSGSAHANQSGTVIALGDGRTWSEATFGADERSWTTANVTTGLILLNSNEADAGGSTAADQNAFVIGVRGSQAAGSTDGTKTAEVGAQFEGSGDVTSFNMGGLVEFIEDPSISTFIGWIGGMGDIGIGYTSMDQQADTTSSANAQQSGTPALGGLLPGGVFVANATGSTWGESTSGLDRSWSNATVRSSNILTAGLIEVDSNQVYADDDGTHAAQTVRIAGRTGIIVPTSVAEGSAWVGSTDGTNYAQVGAGFTSGSMAESYSLLGVPQGYFTQTTNTEASALANQTGRIRSFNSTLGGAWTWNEAGNESGRQVYVETKARSGTILGVPVGVTLQVTNAGAYGSDAYADAFEAKTRSGTSAASTTTAFANNLLGTSTDSSNSATTTGWAWATYTDRYANV